MGISLALAGKFVVYWMGVQHWKTALEKTAKYEDEVEQWKQLNTAQL